MGGLFGGAPSAGNSNVLAPVSGGDEAPPSGPAFGRAASLFSDLSETTDAAPVIGNRSLPPPSSLSDRQPIAEIAPVIGRAATLLSDDSSDGPDAAPFV